MPLQQLSKNPSQLVIDYLFTNYTVDATIQNPTADKIAWNTWYTEVMGKPTIYGSDREDVLSQYVGADPVEYRAYVTLHIFERSLKGKPANLEKLKLYFDKVVNENPQGLDNVGISEMRMISSELLVPPTAEEDIFKLEVRLMLMYWKHIV